MVTLHRECRLLEDLLDECDDDYVGLWSIVACVRRAKYDDAKQVTLALLQFLLSLGVIHAGELDARFGFVPWTLTADEAIHRIRQEWDQLGSDPRLGDIAWFTTCEVAQL